MNFIDFQDFMNRMSSIMHDHFAGNNNTAILAEKIKRELNNTFGERSGNFQTAECANVFITHKNSMDPWYALVIPKSFDKIKDGKPKPSHEIITSQFVSEYSVDIDIYNIVPSMMEKRPGKIDINCWCVWFIHELLSNVITDITYLRFKKALIAHFDRKFNTPIDFNNVVNITWFNIFANTYKSFIDEHSYGFVNKTIKSIDGGEKYWNLALKTWLIAHGGDYDLLSREQMHQSDKNAMEVFGTLGRKFFTDAVRYMDGSYEKYIKYLESYIQSELFSDLASNKPLFISEFDDKDAFAIYPYTRSINESAEYEFTKDNERAKIFKETEELTLDVLNVRTASDKLACAAKLRDFKLLLDKYVDLKSPDLDILSCREKLYELTEKLKTIPTPEYEVLDMY